MRVVIQRAKKASVCINGNEIRSISKGMVILVGFEDNDTSDDIEWLVRKIVQLRIFDDSDGIMNYSVTEIGGDILLISQFTLHASTKKGNRPSYIKAARTEKAIPLYELFIEKLCTSNNNRIKTGEFGAHMDVELINDGPVTIIIDSKIKE